MRRARRSERAVAGRIRVDARPPGGYFSAMAALLPPIHAVETGLAFERGRPYFSHADLATLQPASWSRDPSSWRRVIKEAHGPEPATERTFIHRDSHPGNLLWQRSQVSGLVD